MSTEKHVLGVGGSLSIGVVLNDFNISFEVQTYSWCVFLHYLPAPYG